MRKSLKKLILLFVIVMVSINSFGQKGFNIKNMTCVSLITPGVSYEKKVGKVTTILTNVYIHLGSQDAERGAAFLPDIYIEPAVSIQYRYYFSQGSIKSVNKNTGIYVAAINTVLYSGQSVNHMVSTKKRWVNNLGIALGTQYNDKKRFSTDFSLAIVNRTGKNYNGQMKSSTENEPLVLGQIQMGFWLNRRN